MIVGQAAPATDNTVGRIWVEKEEYGTRSATHAWPIPRSTVFSESKIIHRNINYHSIYTEFDIHSHRVGYESAYLRFCPRLGTLLRVIPALIGPWRPSGTGQTTK